ncbi:Outer membrane protein OmpA [Filimonas lacunae]|uniref:Outer membrane protein OmpA n=1 Tax=Filimonas lacunae TaxID=477680 RepID=A0A173MI42_9BACT|nr:OmpA family protein [Filimonas lacunae]BAV07160.1 outer membrane lipoprotein omp16 precursor [Filimonas lacunae]SIS94085.1 Outer membrane protein OmpA [Filimonas lacunae]
MKWIAKLYIVCAIGATLASPGLYAQRSAGYLKAADKYFNRAEYASAATYYEKYLNAGKGVTAANSDPYAVMQAGVTGNVSSPGNQRLTAIYHLAESYRLLTDYTKAAPYYKEVLEADDKQFLLAQYQYAVVLRTQGEYAAAESVCSAFLKNYTTVDEWHAKATAELANLQFIQQQLANADTAKYVFHKPVDGKAGASYAPLWLNASTVLFTATWQEGNASHINRLYQATYSNGNFTDVVKTNLPVVAAHQGAAAVSEDGLTLYFTAWNVVNGEKHAAIYSSTHATVTDAVWSKPVLLSAAINATGSNTQQPHLMPGGKQLLYVSDKPGGQGGYDIWYATLDSKGQVIATANAGKVINTPGNEQAPYYHAPSGTLVFTTDGRTGMGGYDLFYSKGTPGYFAAPVNFGYPVNSVKDDMYFASSGKGEDILENVLFCSDRSATCCLELLALQVKPAPVAVKPEPVQQVTEQPVVTVTEPLVVIPRNPAQPMVLNHVYYTLNSAEIQPASFPALNQLADSLLANPHMVVEIGGHTDSTGSGALNQALSQSRADHVKAYLVSKGVNKNRISAKGYGSDKPLAPNTYPDGTDNPEGREKNRRTEITIIRK